MDGTIVEVLSEPSKGKFGVDERTPGYSRQYLKRTSSNITHSEWALLQRRGRISVLYLILEGNRSLNRGVGQTP
jgi:hypothetical protein